MHCTVVIIYLLSAASLSIAAGDNPSPVLSCMFVMANETGVWAPVGIGAGVLDLVAGALRL
jgi:hypothetical protein